MSTNDHTSAVEATPPSDDDQLIAALARGASYQEAANECGICKRTVTRRMTDAGFRLRVDEARRDWLTIAVSKLSSALGEIVETLLQMSRDGESETTRFHAARTLFSSLIPLRGQLDIEARIAALEARQ